MRTPTRFYASFAAALFTLAGCDQRSISAPLPAAPGPMPAPAEPGQIAVVQVTPLAGAGYAIGCYRDGNWCNMKLVVDVQLDQDVAEPWVTASFYNGSQRCGGTLSVRDSASIDPLRANTVTRFTTGPITMSAAQDGTFCTATTRMVVQVWGERGRSAAPLLTREFAHSWTTLWSETWDD